jgi:hypothetical protein
MLSRESLGRLALRCFKNDLRLAAQFERLKMEGHSDGRSDKTSAFQGANSGHAVGPKLIAGCIGSGWQHTKTAGQDTSTQDREFELVLSGQGHPNIRNNISTSELILWNNFSRLMLNREASQRYQEGVNALIAEISFKIEEILLARGHSVNSLNIDSMWCSSWASGTAIALHELGSLLLFGTRLNNTDTSSDRAILTNYYQAFTEAVGCFGHLTRDGLRLRVTSGMYSFYLDPVMEDESGNYLRILPDSQLELINFYSDFDQMDRPGKTELAKAVKLLLPHCSKRMIWQPQHFHLLPKPARQIIKTILLLRKKHDLFQLLPMDMIHSIIGFSLSTDFILEQEMASMVIERNTWCKTPFFTLFIDLLKHLRDRGFIQFDPNLPILQYQSLLSKFCQELLAEIPSDYNGDPYVGGLTGSVQWPEDMNWGTYVASKENEALRETEHPNPGAISPFDLPAGTFGSYRSAPRGATGPAHSPGDDDFD